MTLGDLSNLILTTLQQPGASFTVGGGGGPNWASLTNPQYSQGLVEFSINEGYRATMGDLWDMQLTVVTFTLTSTVNTFKYAIPPSGYSNIGHVVRVFYQPKGLPYTQEFRPGVGLIAWDEFQQTYTGEGYLAPYSFATQPYVCTIDPLLQNLYFYPGSNIAGDTITVDYQPLPGNTTGAPLLTAQTSTPLLPVDTHMAIFYYAMHLLWVRARETAESQRFFGLYDNEIQKARFKYSRKHMGDNQRIVPQIDYLGMRDGF